MMVRYTPNKANYSKLCIRKVNYFTPGTKRNNNGLVGHGWTHE